MTRGPEADTPGSDSNAVDPEHYEQQTERRTPAKLALGAVQTRGKNKDPRRPRISFRGRYDPKVGRRPLPSLSVQYTARYPAEGFNQGITTAWVIGRTGGCHDGMPRTRPRSESTTRPPEASNREACRTLTVGQASQCRHRASQSSDRNPSSYRRVPAGLPSRCRRLVLGSFLEGFGGGAGQRQLGDHPPIRCAGFPRSHRVVRHGGQLPGDGG